MHQITSRCLPSSSRLPVSDTFSIVYVILNMHTILSKITAMLFKTLLPNLPFVNGNTLAKFHDKIPTLSLLMVIGACANNYINELFTTLLTILKLSPINFAQPT